MDLTTFDGNNALQQIFQAEQFFDYYDISDSYRLKVVAIHFDGLVVPWFQMLQKNGAVTLWSALAKAIESTYGPSVYESPRYVLFKLCQAGTVTNYYNIFTALVNHVDGLSPDVVLDCLVSGLHKELQREVIPWRPANITDAFTLAKLFEDKYDSGDQTSKFKSQFSPDISATFRKLALLALPAPLPPSHKLPTSSTTPASGQPFTR